MITAPYQEAQYGYLFDFFNTKVCLCSHLNSKEYTQYTIFNIQKKIILNYPKSAAIGFCSKVLKNGFETAMVNEPSVFEPLFDSSENTIKGPTYLLLFILTISTLCCSLLSILFKLFFFCFVKSIKLAKTAKYAELSLLFG